MRRRLALPRLRQVAYLVRTPYWRTYSEEQPAVLSTEFATAKEGEAACGKWAVSGRHVVAPGCQGDAVLWHAEAQQHLAGSQAGLTARLCGRGKPDICFVFVSARRYGGKDVLSWLPCHTPHARHVSLTLLLVPAAALATCLSC